MRIQVPNAGQYGLIRDVDSIRIPINSWTDGKNIRFKSGEVLKSLGTLEALDPTPTDASFIIPVTKIISGVPTQYWIYAGGAKVYSYDGTTEADITNTTADYTGGSGDLWSACVNQGLLVMANGKDVPQMWLGDELEDLIWDGADTFADAGYNIKIIRNYKNFLIGLQFYNGTVWNPYSVYWSNPAEPLTYPDSWDYTSATTLSGIQELTTTQGEIVDGLTLRDYFMVYKSDGITVMSNIGGQAVMGFRDLSSTTGLLAQNCVKEFFNQHFIVSTDDVVITDGNTIKSVIANKMRSKLFSEIDSTNYGKSFVIPYYNKTEMWICYPSTGNTYPNRALIWNWDEDTWSVRDLLSIRHASPGILWATSSNTWDSDTDTWDSDSTNWDDSAYNPTVNKLVGTNGTQILRMDEDYTLVDNSYESYITREWITLGKSDTIKRITAIYPKCEGICDISVGYSMHQNDPFTWEGPYRFDPDSDAQIRCRVTGRYHAVKFQFIGDSEHKLHSYDIEFVDTGQGR